MRRPLRGAIAGAAVLLLAGCFNPTRPEGANSPEAQRNWEARRASLTRLQNFSLQGRLAETGLVSFGGALSWAQSGPAFQARFYGPLGVGAVSISGTPDDMEIRSKDSSVRTRDPEAYMQRQFGWSLPLDGLRYWVLGLPAPGGEPQLRLDEQGRILSLKQNGWELAYTEYQDVGALQLPKKFTVSDTQRGFKVFIDAWLGAE